MKNKSIEQQVKEDEQQDLVRWLMNHPEIIFNEAIENFIRDWFSDEFNGESISFDGLEQAYLSPKFKNGLIRNPDYVHREALINRVFVVLTSECGVAVADAWKEKSGYLDKNQLEALVRHFEELKVEHEKAKALQPAASKLPVEWTAKRIKSLSTPELKQLVQQYGKDIDDRLAGKN